MCDLNCIEDEFHVILTCPMYDDIREALSKEANIVNPAFNHFTELEMFIYYMSNYEMAKYSAKACRQILDRRRNFVIK